MADTTAKRTIVETGHKSQFLFVNKSDGTGESAVQKVDISALPGSPTKIKITKICWSVKDMGVQILFDHTTDDLVAVLIGDGELKCDIEDPASTGGTGDILFTTFGHANNAAYQIFMEVEAVA